MVILLDDKLVPGDGLDLIFKGVSFQIYPLAPNLALQLACPVLLQLDGKGGEDRKLRLEEEDDLGEPLVGQVLKIKGLQLHLPCLFYGYRGWLHHGFEEGSSGIGEHLLRRFSVGSKFYVGCVL